MAINVKVEKNIIAIAARRSFKARSSSQQAFLHFLCSRVELERLYLVLKVHPVARLSSSREAEILEAALPHPTSNPCSGTFSATFYLPTSIIKTVKVITVKPQIQTKKTKNPKRPKIGHHFRYHYATNVEQHYSMEYKIDADVSSEV